MANSKREPVSKLELPPWPGRLQEARLRLNLSEKEVAKRAGIGVSEQTVKNMEQGKGRVVKFLLVCQALGVHPADICNGEVDLDKIRGMEGATTNGAMVPRE